MATKLSDLALEVAHFNNFKDFVPGIDLCCTDTVEHLIHLGGVQVSTLFEHALAKVGGHTVVSMDKGDLYSHTKRRDRYSDAKLSTVRTSGYGKSYSAPVCNIFNKTGTLRVQVYERKQNKFFYFAIPRRAYINIPKSSNIEIPFSIDGEPRRNIKRRVYADWWKYEVKSFTEMASA